MSTLVDKIAAVLAEHPWHHTRTTHCRCGFRTPLAQLAIDGYNTHVAQQIAAAIEHDTHADPWLRGLLTGGGLDE